MGQTSHFHRFVIKPYTKQNVWMATILVWMHHLVVARRKLYFYGTFDRFQQFWDKDNIISQPTEQIKRKEPHCDPPIYQENRSDCYNPGPDRWFGKIMTKSCIGRQMSDFWRYFEQHACILSTHLSILLQTTARQSTSIPKKLIEYAQPWSGSNILRDISQIPVFTALGRFWGDFEQTVHSLDPEWKFMFIDRTAIHTCIKLNVWNGWTLVRTGYLTR